MAVTVDQANIGTSAVTGFTNNTFNTTATVAAGAMIVQIVHRFRSGGGGVYTGSTTGNGLTWTTCHSVTSGNVGIYLIAAFAPSGLASGTSIGVNSTVGSNDYTMAAASYLGIDTSSTVTAAITGIGGAAASTAAWATGTIAGNSGDAYIGGAGGDGTVRTSTATAPAQERIDFNSATSSGSITLVDTLSGGASDNLAGTWSGTLTHVAIGVAFKAAAAAAVDIPFLVMAPPIPA